MVETAKTTGTITFQGKYPEEQFQFFFRQHWIRLFVPFFRTFLLSTFLAIAGVVAFTSSFSQDAAARHVLLLFLLFFFLIIQFELLEKFYNYILYMVVVTDRRIHRIKKTLFLTDDQQSIDLWVLQDIIKSQHGLMQVIFGFGTLELEAQETVLRLHFIPKVGQKYQQLMHLRESARRRMGTASDSQTIIP